MLNYDKPYLEIGIALTLLFVFYRIKKEGFGGIIYIVFFPFTVFLWPIAIVLLAFFPLYKDKAKEIINNL